MKNESVVFVTKCLKFGIVGVISTIANYGLFTLLLKAFGLYYILSAAAGYITGLVLGFYLNKNWTFVAQIDRQKSHLFLYSIVYIISLIFSQMLLFSLVEKLKLDPLLANVFAICLSTIMNFMGTNYFVFIKR